MIKFTITSFLIFFIQLSLHAQSNNFLLHVRTDSLVRSSPRSCIVISGDGPDMIKGITGSGFTIAIDPVISYPRLVLISYYPHLSQEELAYLQSHGRSDARRFYKSVFISDASTNIVIHTDSISVTDAGDLHSKYERIESDVMNRVNAFNRQTGDRLHEQYRASDNQAFRDSVRRLCDSLFVITAARLNLDSVLMPAIIENINNPLSFYAIGQYIWMCRALELDIPLANFREILQAMPEKQKRSNRWKELVDLTENLSANNLVGKQAPDFSNLKDTSGNRVQLKDLKGKLVFVDFWASWCAPCMQQFPMLRSIYSSLKEANVVFVGISVDNNLVSWKEGIIGSKAAWINISDLKGINGQTPLKYNIFTIPHNFLINKEGIVIGADIPLDKLEMTIKKNL